MGCCAWSFLLFVKLVVSLKVVVVERGLNPTKKTIVKGAGSLGRW